MARKLSPEAQARHDAAAAAWHKANLESLCVAVPKGSKARYMACAAARGQSLRALVIELLENACAGKV